MDKHLDIKEEASPYEKIEKGITKCWDLKLFLQLLVLPQNNMKNLLA